MYRSETYALIRGSCCDDSTVPPPDVSVRSEDYLRFDVPRPISLRPVLKLALLYGLYYFAINNSTVEGKRWVRDVNRINPAGHGLFITIWYSGTRGGLDVTFKCYLVFCAFGTLYSTPGPI